MKIMRTFCIIILSFLFFKSYSQDNTNAIKNHQDRNSEKFIIALEKGDTSAAISQIDKVYFSKNQKRLRWLFAAFMEDFKNLPTDNKRFSTLVFPDGYYLFRLRYVDKRGVILQMDVSYKEADIKSKIIGLGLITTKSWIKVLGENIVPKNDY